MEDHKYCPQCHKELEKGQVPRKIMGETRKVDVYYCLDCMLEWDENDPEILENKKPVESEPHKEPPKPEPEKPGWKQDDMLDNFKEMHILANKPSKHGTNSSVKKPDKINSKNIVDKVKNGEIKPSLFVPDVEFYNLDDENIVYLNGCEFRYKKFQEIEENGNERWSDVLKFNAPIKDLKLIKQRGIFKISYIFDREQFIDTMDETIRHIKNKMKLDGSSAKLFAEYIYLFKTEKEKSGDYETEHAEIEIIDDKIKVNKTTDQPVKDILEILAEISKMSTHPQAFMTSLCYDIMAPLSYNIRLQGQKFPYRLLTGATNGGKTQIEELLTLTGYAQPIDKRKENLNTIKTIFTFGKQVEKSNLPFVIDDINNEWLKKQAEELKGATDGVKFMARGNINQTQNIYEMVGMPIFTMNAEPVIPLALNNRLIANHFSQDNSDRQNKAEFERLKDKLKSGFLFNIVKEGLEGTSISDVIRDIYKTDIKTDSEINKKIIEYGYNVLDRLAKKYNLEFPEMPVLEENNNDFDMLELFTTYVATRLKSADRDGTTFQKFAIKWNDATRRIQEVYVTTTGYRDFIKFYDLKGLDTMQDLINELKTDKIKKDSKWIPSLHKPAKCLVIPSELIEKDNKEEIELQLADDFFNTDKSD
jgi:hypothetical protein